MSAQSNLEQIRDFSQKLPESVLYNIETPKHFSGNNRLDWFSYLEKIDEASGRAADYSGRDGDTKKEFPYISFHRDEFLAIVDPLAANAKSFIDVGCGGGDKLQLVKERYSWFTKVHGVEHDPTMAIWARLYGDKVFCKDAFKVNYSKYDIIYAYWPIFNSELMGKLRDRIMNQMHQTAKFVLVGFHSYGNEAWRDHPRAKDVISGRGR